MTRRPTDVAASVRARLLNRSRASGEDFQFLLQRYAAERFLYRLGESPHREAYVLKGAMLFPLWGGSIYRATHDLDFCGYGTSATDRVLATLREVCAVAVPNDGLAFEVGTLRAETIRGDAEYDGLRIRLDATLAGARIPMQIDIGFGNAIEPPAAEVEYPTLLDALVPRIRAYPHEAVVAEKLHAAVVLGERNSRFKDFYDLYVLARQFAFDGGRLARAIAATFERRRTPISAALPAALTPRFYADAARAEQWRAYLTRNALPGAPADFVAVGEVLQAFLGPPWQALADRRAFSEAWPASGPWVAPEATRRQALTARNVRAPKPTQRALAEPQAARAEGAVARAAEHGRRKTGLRRYKAYPTYKDSGVEWLGEIPGHWEVNPIRALARPGYKTFTDGDWIESPFIRDQGIRLIQTGNVGVGEYEEQGFRYIDEETFRAFRCTEVLPGDVLICRLADPVGRACLAPDLGCRMITSVDVCILKPARDVDAAFVVHALSGPEYLAWLGGICRGGTRDRVSRSMLGAIRVQKPPLAEQRSIAAFLDRETARIDSLVAKEERLIDLLQEKRTALITCCVTKGLDSTAPLKDSGVEWLGQIPAHWEVRKVKRLCLVRRGASPRPIDDPIYFDDEGEYAWVRIADVTASERYLETTTQRLSDLGRSKSVALEPGDLFLSIAATVGKPIITRIKCCIHDGFVYFVGLRENREYLYYLFSCGEPYKGLGKLGTQLNLNTDTVGDIYLPRPSLREQEAIVLFLDRETAQIDSLITKVREAIDRLKELRTALISAAVTGKIDVREEVA